MIPRKTVCIIGGGFAGLSSAVFLDSLGYRAHVLEKKPLLGGRTYSFQDRKTQTWVDNGQHLMMGAYHETIRFLENIGAKRLLHFQKNMEVPLVSETLQFDTLKIPALPSPFNLLLGLLKMKSFTLKDKWNFLKLGQELKNIRNGKPSISLDQTVRDWLTQLGQSEKIITLFWEPLTLATLNDAPEKASARMLAVVLEKGLLGHKNDSRLIFPKNSLNDLLAKPARDYLELRGHTIETGKSIKLLHILDNQVRAAETDTGEMIKTDLYVSAVPFFSFLKIIPSVYAESLPYFTQIQQLKTSPIVSINLWFDQDIMTDHSFIGVAAKKIHWYFNKNKMEDIKTPPYHYMGVISGAYEFLEKSREEIINIALDELFQIFPKAQNARLIHCLVNKEREATLSCTVGSERYRPQQQSPFSNFYVVGDWTHTGFPATIESAVLSSKMMCEAVEKNQK